MTRAAWRLLRQFASRKQRRINHIPSPPTLRTPAASAYSTTAESACPTRLPPPIRVSLTESAGRGVFSTRRIGAGDLIHTAMPVVAHPSLPLLHKVCYFCLKRLVIEASGCNAQSDGHTPSSTDADTLMSTNQVVHFCSDECRESSQAFYDIEKRADWSAYDDHCRLQGLKYPLLVKRFACMVTSGVASVNDLHILQPANLVPEMILQMQEEFQLLRSGFMTAGFQNEQIAFLTKQWYLDVLARIRINAFRIELIGGYYENLLSSAVASVEAEAAAGNGVYMLPSFYNHDCDPNTHIVWIENVNARIKALRDIEEGEELRICYIDASMNREARQSFLLRGFGFQCQCFRCISGDN